jgi:transposase-like protein
VTKTNALETLVIAGFVRGLSVRDVEATLADALGPQAALSKSTVSRVCQAIRDEFDAWRTRRLDEVELDYLFCDGSHFKMHAGTRAEPVLAAWGVTTAGKPVLVGLDAAGNEGNDAWDDFLDGLKARGLRPPLLVISDGAAGLVGALERTMARSLRQRCLIHRCRNVLAKVPAKAQAEVKTVYWAIFNVPNDTPAGEKAEVLVQQRIQAFAATYHTVYPAAVRCLQQDQQALTAYLRFPREHWHRIRHSNFIERTFGETRRRVKVIGRSPARPAASRSSGPCWTGPPAAGAASPSPRPEPVYYKTFAANCSTHPRRSADTPSRSTNPPPTRPNIDHHGAALRRHLHRSRDATFHPTLSRLRRRTA